MRRSSEKGGRGKGGTDSILNKNGNAIIEEEDEDGVVVKDVRTLKQSPSHPTKFGGKPSPDKHINSRQDHLGMK